MVVREADTSAGASDLLACLHHQRYLLCRGAVAALPVVVAAAAAAERSLVDAERYCTGTRLAQEHTRWDALAGLAGPGRRSYIPRSLR